MLTFLAGIGTAFFVVIVFAITMTIMETRESRIRSKINDEINKARETRLSILEAQSAHQIEEWRKTAPAALEIVKSFESAAEIVIRRESAMFTWPAGVPPAVVSGLLKNVAARIDYELECSDSIHKGLFGQD